MGDRIAVMRKGKIEQIGTFDELYYTPGEPVRRDVHRLAADGVIPATIEAGRAAVPGGNWQLPDDLVGSLPTGPVRIGVRPEGWLLDTADGAPLKVRHLERIPTERASFLYGRLGEANVAVTAPVDYPDRSEVAITPDWERAYVFAADGEEPHHVPGVLELF